MPTPTARIGNVWLITPATAPDRFDATRHSAPDVALLDLEDSVPHSDKDTARSTAIAWLSTMPEDGVTALGLRINALSTAHGLRDVVAVAEADLRHAVLLVPKVEDARDVELVAHVLGAETGPRRVWALIETPRAIGRLHEILSARALGGVVFGPADYAAAVGCARTSDALRYPRSALVAGAAAAGVPAIDAPCFALTDTAELRREAEDACRLGFAGKGAVHPAQVQVIRDAFRPSDQDLAAARAVIAAAEAAGGAVTTVDGRMVGPPMVAAARVQTSRAGVGVSAGTAGGSP